MENISGLLLLSIALTVSGIISALFLPAKIKAHSNFIHALLIGITTSVPAIDALLGNSTEFSLNAVPFFSDMSIRIDPLASWFILIVNLTCINGALYGIGYMKPYIKAQEGNLASNAGFSLHWSMFILFQSSMVWVCMIQHGLAFLILWELMSLASFFLVIFEHQNINTLKAGINYLVQMHIGVIFLSIAFIWVYFVTGSFDFHAISDFFDKNTNLWLFLLFLAGFGIKAGFIPLHSWLPHAHPAAPSHVSGIMSGVIVKMGIYGIIRVALMLVDELSLIGEILLILSIFTALYGILNAAVHRDFKKMLAYCTIENIGIIGSGIGLYLIGAGSNNVVLKIAGLSGALLHTLNHSLFKSLLFFSAGSVYQQTHNRDMEKLGGLSRYMPHTSVLFLLGALAIGGLPPFNGFVSEFLIYSGFLNGIKTTGFHHATLMILSLCGLVITGGLSLLTFTKSYSVIFSGIPRQEHKQIPQEPSLVMRLPQYLIVAIMLSIGLFPQFFLKAVFLISGSQAQPEENVFMVKFLELITVTGRCSALFIFLLGAGFLVRRFFRRKDLSSSGFTWGCGYSVSPATAAKMQYTGKSFSKTLGKLFSFIVTEKKKYKELSPGEIFPESKSHSSHYPDFFEDTIFNKVINKIISGMGYFRFIQNGRIQLYVLYGVLFIVLVFLGTIFNML